MEKFTESQRMADSTFNKIILVLVFVLQCKTIYNGIFEGFNGMGIFSVVILGLVLILFILFQLKTVITSESINLKINPFNIYNQTINWKDVKKCEVIEYSAIKEYGGWGYRRNKSGIAINPSGNKGLKIYFKNGKQLLIGTKKEEELKAFLKAIKHYII